MVIIGAGGFAKELAEIVTQQVDHRSIAFYDDVNTHGGALVFDRFPVLKNESEVKEFFLENGNDFVIGIGNPLLRHKLCQRFIEMGGVLRSMISAQAIIGSFEVKIGEGSNVLAGATFSNCTSVGRGCIIYYGAVITHNCNLGDYVQVSPGVNILGTVEIGDYVMIGAAATILPKLNIGKHAVIAAGAVVTKSVPAYALMIGNPARRTGWVNEFGDKLVFDDRSVAICPRSGDRYVQRNNILVKE